MGMFRGKDRRVNGDALLVFVCMKDCDGGWGIVTDRSKCQVIEYNSLFEEWMIQPWERFKNIQELTPLTQMFIFPHDSRYVFFQVM